MAAIKIHKVGHVWITATRPSPQRHRDAEGDGERQFVTRSCFSPSSSAISVSLW